MRDGGLYDIDILIQLKEGQDMLVVRERLEELDAHFASAGVKFYFVKVRRLSFVLFCFVFFFYAICASYSCSR